MIPNGVCGTGDGGPGAGSGGGQQALVVAACGELNGTPAGDAAAIARTSCHGAANELTNVLGNSTLGE